MLRIQATSAGRHRSRAQAIVEAALIFPIVILLLMGVVDFGRVFYHQMVLASAVREGARVGSDSTATNTKIENAVTAAAPTGLLTCCTISPSGTRRSGDTISVTATFSMTPIAPGMSLILSPVLSSGKLVLSQTAQMVVL